MCTSRQGSYRVDVNVDWSVGSLKRNAFVGNECLKIVNLTVSLQYLLTDFRVDDLAQNLEKLKVLAHETHLVDPFAHEILPRLTRLREFTITHFRSMSIDLRLPASIRHVGLEHISLNSVMMSALVLSLHSLPRLVSLSIRYPGDFDSESQSILSLLFRHCRNIKVLKLYGVRSRHSNYLGSLRYLSNLEHLDITHSDVHNMTLFANSLRPLNQLRVLTMEAIKLTCLASLMHSLVNKENLQKLSIRDNYLSSDGMYCILTGILHLNQLSHLDISGNTINNKVVAYLSRIIPAWPALESLDLSGAVVGGAWSRLAQSLTFTHLRSLKLKRCNFMCLKSRHLNSLLASVPYLEILDLDHAHIGDRGLRIISSNLGSLSNLSFLNLRKTLISYKIVNWTSSLKSMSRLKHLDLSRNNLLSSGLESLCTALEDKINLKTLMLSSIDMDSGGLYRLAKSLHRWPNLETLDIFGNDQIRSSLLVLINALLNTKVVNVNVSQTGISPHLEATLTKYLNESKYLKSVKIGFPRDEMFIRLKNVAEKRCIKYN